MAISNNIIKFISALGYTAIDGEPNTWSKTYDSEMAIKVDVNGMRAHYPIATEATTGFKQGRKTSEDLNKQENWSVLECVDRLLMLGYKSNNITLERSFSTTGKSNGAWVDISIALPDKNETYMLIEVKQPSEYQSAIRKSFQRSGKAGDGEPKGELIGYFNLDRTANFIVYYTSAYDTQSDSITYRYDYISTEEDYLGRVDDKDTTELKLKTTRTLLEVFERWNKSYSQNGLFENGVAAYKGQKKAIIKSTLLDLADYDANGSIFGQFLTILRAHSIGDKSNAFNKIFNLFLCKIYDEDSKEENDETDFQWKTSDTYENLFTRLSDLFKNGTNKYLGISINDHSSNEFEDLIASVESPDTCIALRAMFNQLRLQRTGEFSFMDVFDNATFMSNAAVVKDIVILLQSYRLKYGKKQQFLGDFFESLLNTGVKQENGQFFTPIPLARFVVNSIPIENIIRTKIQYVGTKTGPEMLKDRNLAILPFSLDYAAGSGHFLTELMDEVQSTVITLGKEKWKSTRVESTLKNFNNIDNPYNWAPHFIYGLEKDYRLAKTAKVACF